MNITIVSGVVDRQPNVRDFGEGKRKVEFTLKERVSQGEKSFDKFHHVVAWDSEARDILDNPELYRSGTKVVVAGRLQARTWTKRDGTTVPITELVMKQDILSDPELQSAFSDMVKTGQCMLSFGEVKTKDSSPDDDDDLPF